MELKLHGLVVYTNNTDGNVSAYNTEGNVSASETIDFATSASEPLPVTLVIVTFIAVLAAITALAVYFKKRKP